LLVNSQNSKDDKSKVDNFYRKWQQRAGSKLALPSVIDDTLLSKLFPHQLIPHYVWIDKYRRVVAITSSDPISSENIKAAIEGKPLTFVMKKEQDARRPVFSNNDLPQVGLITYMVFVKGRFDGLPGGSRWHQKDGIVYGHAITNTGLFYMYYEVARKLDRAIKSEHVIAEVKDSLQLFPPRVGDKRDSWYKDHEYTLDVVVPKEEAGQLYHRMLELLNLYSGYVGQFENRNGRKVFVIKEK
jgi:hypothetical protein